MLIICQLTIFGNNNASNTPDSITVYRVIDSTQTFDTIVPTNHGISHPKTQMLTHFVLLETFDPWQHNATLPLVFTHLVPIRCFTNLVTLKEQTLRNAFIGINLGWKRC